MSMLRKIQDLIPMVPYGYETKVEIHKSRKGDGYKKEDKARMIDTDRDEQQVKRLELKDEGETIHNIPFSKISRERYYSWKFLKWKYRDYIELVEGDDGKYTAMDTEVDDKKKVVDVAEASNKWDNYEKYQTKNTIETWESEDKLKKYLPYIVLVIVIIGQIVMLRQQNAHIKELIDIATKGGYIIPLMGVKAKNVLSK